MDTLRSPLPVSQVSRTAIGVPAQSNLSSLAIAETGKQGFHLGLQHLVHMSLV
jgi:hypothetical protein